MNATELIKFMMNFVVYQSFIIICSVISDNVINSIYIQFVDNFYPVKEDDNTSTGSTRYILYLISLKSCLKTEKKTSNLLDNHFFKI